MPFQAIKVIYSYYCPMQDVYLFFKKIIRHMKKKEENNIVKRQNKKTTRHIILKLLNTQDK